MLLILAIIIFVGLWLHSLISVSLRMEKRNTSMGWALWVIVIYTAMGSCVLLVILRDFWLN